MSTVSDKIELCLKVTGVLVVSLLVWVVLLGAATSIWWLDATLEKSGGFDTKFVLIAVTLAGLSSIVYVVRHAKQVRLNQPPPAPDTAATPPPPPPPPSSSWDDDEDVEEEMDLDDIP